MKTKALSAAFIALFIVIASLLLVESNTQELDGVQKNGPSEITTVSDDKEKISFADASFGVFYSSDAMQADQLLANDVTTVIYELYKVRLRAKPDTSTAASDKEILIGNTDRQESAKLLEAITAFAPSADDLVWGYAVINGKLLYTANSQLAFEYGRGEFVTYLTQNDFTIPDDLSVINIKTRAEYDAEIEANEELKRELRIKELIATNKAFKQSDFGGMPLEMPTDRYKDPTYYPAADQHPRLFFTEDKIDDIYNNLLNNPDFETLREKFWEYANAENFTGIFPTEYKKGVPYQYSSTVLAQLEAKALAYILTGDVIYGYEAIIGAKNVMLSLNYIKEIHADTYHGASHVMVNVSKVYDWCYDLLTDDDKNQIIAGVCHVLAPQLENGMKFPPSGMSAVSGHGTGPQFTRDWMTVSLAFYDEVPSWWDFVAGRYFEQYVPIIDYCYQGGYASQGTTTYGDSKYFTKSWAAWLIKTSTGEFPYVENFHLGAYYYFSHIQSNGYYFQTGDGGRSAKGCGIEPNFMFLAAAFFNDPVIANMAKKYSNDYTKFSYAVTMEYTVCDVLIWHTYGPDLSKYDEEDLQVDLIQYLPYPSGTMTARNSWSADGAAVLMRIAEMTMANHDLNDHGTFQIYYKGLLAGTSGAYNEYGSYVHRYYLQATVAHNGLLVFDPSLADDVPKYGTKAPCDSPDCDHTTCTIDYTTIKNAARYYYSGSQRARSEAGTIENWLSGEYNMAEVYGADWGYDLTDGSAEYAYIAGDLTPAYESKTVNYVGRKMLTIFTDDPNYPMLFFTYDQMTSVEGGEHFTKTFLLHTVKEPEIDEKNLTAVVTQDQGRLFVHSLCGAKTITKIGGEGFAYWVNGKNLTDHYSPTDNYNVIWGRLELSTSGNLSDNLLTAMYVTDATNDTPLEVEKFTSEFVDGAKIKDKIAVFTKSDSTMQTYKTFSFEVEGNGLYTYYVAGLEAGTWQVIVDGVTVATAYSEEGGSMITFTAPCGKVVINPGKDVIGANGGKIKYNTFGGVLSDKAPLAYNNEDDFPLTADITRGSDIFLGWYTSPNYEPETAISFIPKGTIGTVTIYAKYLSTLVDVDFKDPTFNVNAIESNKTQEINFQASKKAGASFITKTDENGVQYLEWIKGSDDPLINYSSKTSNYATMASEDECATYTITLSKNGDAPMMNTQFRIYTKKTVSGGSATTRQYIFTTNAEGEVRLGSSANGPLVTTLTEEATTIKFVMDFKNEEIRAFDKDGNPLASLKVSVNAASEAANMSEWRKLLDDVVLYWYASSSAEAATSSMRIYDIKIEESDRVEAARGENAIIYSHGGSKMPSDAPYNYSKETPTVLPTPEMNNAVFEGWYTTPDFAEGTLITEIPTDTEGNITVYAKWTLIPEDGSIVYHLGIGELPKDAPLSFSKTEATTLPILTTEKVNYTFAGWYTSPELDQDSFITEIPAGTEGWVEVYAKWIFEVYEDFSDDIGVEGENNTTTLSTNVNLAASSCPGASYKVMTDESGRTYLEWNKGEGDPRVTMTTGDIAKSTSTSFSYEIVIGYNGDEPFAGFSFRTLAKVDVNGSKLSSNNQLYMFAVNADGAYISNGGKNDFNKTDVGKFADFKDGIITIRVEIDFAKELIIGYRDDGTTVESKFVVPQSSGASNGIEYMKTFTDYVFYLYTQGDDNSSSRIYSIKVVNDKIFDSLTKENRINYSLADGALPEGAPTHYSTEAPTALPIPTKTGYTFDGWFTTPTFEDGTLITEVPTDAAGIFTVYAKWSKLPEDGKINYNLAGGTLPEGAPEYFEKDSATVLPIPEKANAIFKGWYTSPDFAEETLITEIPAGLSGEFTVYANWLSLLLYEDYSETEIDIVSSSTKKNSITYNAKSKEGGAFKTDGEGNRYLVWTNGTQDPIISIGEGLISKMSGSLISYEIRFARNGDAPFMQTTADARAQVDVNGNKLSPSAKISLFGTSKTGNVYLGSGTSNFIGTVPTDGSEFVLRILVDFANLTLFAYADDGTIVSTTFKIPKETGATTGEELQKLFTTFTLYWQGGKANSEEGASIRIESFKLAEGNIFE